MEIIELKVAAAVSAAGRPPGCLFLADQYSASSNLNQPRRWGEFHEIMGVPYVLTWGPVEEVE